MERVLITGLGVVSCLGSGVEAYWNGLLRGKSRPAPVPDPLAKMANRLLYRVDDWEDLPTASAGERLGRATGFAVRAAEQAFRDAGLEPAALRPPVGVAVGTGMGDNDLFEAERGGGPRPRGLESFPFKTASTLAAEFGLAGPNLSVSTACSASAYSVSLAAEAIRGGAAQVMLAGGADSYTRVGVACFNRLGALDPVVCRPFDAERAGTVFGEGAALMVLESEAHAAARGHPRGYAAVEGAGWSCDGHHPTAPEPSGERIVAAMREALQEASLGPGEVGCVVPHGTGTRLNDQVEAEALERVFGERIAGLPVCNLKGMLGHTGGAAGAFSCLTAALIIDRGVVPPNANPGTADPDCPLRLDSEGQDLAPVAHTMVNAYAFGGNNISVVLGSG